MSLMIKMINPLNQSELIAIGGFIIEAIFLSFYDVVV